jgi:transposase
VDAKKRTVAASEQDPARRAAWWDEVAPIAREELIFIDESGTNVTATPRYGWAPKGARAHGRAPRNYGQNTTLVAAMTVRGITAALTVPGALDGAAFDVFLTQILLPRLRPGQVVVLDNLSVHTRTSVRARIEAAGCQLRYLPPYSPDFNPIEQGFSKLKGYLRQVEARTQEALDGAISAGLAMITAADASGWFRHCGYEPPGQPL